MVNKHMTGCSTSSITREMQVKTPMRCHLMPIKMATIKTQKIGKCNIIKIYENVEKSEPSYATHGNGADVLENGLVVPEKINH